MTDLFGDAREIEKAAVISDCGLYRYSLTRKWGEAPLLPFIMLNPSTADAQIDDPTVRRCIGFARREDTGGIIIVNLYAFRSASPQALWKASDPIGPDCDLWIAHAAIESKPLPIICAWGAHAREDRWADVAFNLNICARRRLVCLGRTREGKPRHPLYVRADQPLEPFP